MSGILRDQPWGYQVLESTVSKCCPHRRVNRMSWHQGGILALTYLAYTCYHMTRKPISVVKNVLSLNCSTLSPPPNFLINNTNKDTWCDWAPFDTENAPALLGMLDSAFLFAYAASMFFSGFIAERVNLRYFLTFGMLASGISCYLFGIAKSYNIHSLWYFILVQAIGGVFQTSGWPGVVTVVGNWFGKGKRGLIFGIWNSHTSLGNILGSLIAAEFVESDWGLSFMVPGATMGLAGFIIFLFLVPNPIDIGCIPPVSLGYRKFDATHSSDESSDIDDCGNCSNDIEDVSLICFLLFNGVFVWFPACGVLIEILHNYYFGTVYPAFEFTRLIYRCAYREQIGDDDVVEDLISVRSETSPILSRHRRLHNRQNGNAIGFLGALSIPGVIEYSLSLFFAKLVSYTFLYWLPLYIAASTTYSAALSADLSTLFDVGGIAGAIAAGILSDYSGMSAVTCAVMFGFAVPVLFIYDYIGRTGLGINIVLLLVAGLLVNGPYALITTAVSAELGTHPSLGDNSKALATVTAIIDGTGSIGAAVGPLLAGLVSRWSGWHNVFNMLMCADILALLLLSRLVYKDLQKYIYRRAV